MPVLEGVRPARFALSASATVLYTTGAASARPTLVWVSRDGTRRAVDSTWRGDFEYPALSPDGASLAVSVRDGTTHLWMRRADGTRQKLTEAGTRQLAPFLDARRQRHSLRVRTAAAARARTTSPLYQAPADGSAQPQLLLRHHFGPWEAELSRDGQWLVMRADEHGQRRDHPRAASAGRHRAAPIVGGPRLHEPAVAALPRRPLARLLLGRPGSARSTSCLSRRGASRLVSRDGGTEPRWARERARALLQERRPADGRPGAPGPGASAPACPGALFSVAGYRRARNRQQYDVAPDGQRFLMIRIRNRSTGGSRSTWSTG